MQTNRLKIDTSAPKTRAQFSATVWRASALALELGLFSAGVPLTLADYSSITLRVRKARLAEAVLLEVVTPYASLTACTAPQWAAGTHEHARLVLTSEQMNLPLTSKLDTLHVTISGVLVASGSVEVLGMGEMIMHDANAVPGEVAENADPATSLPECDARFVRYDGPQTLTTEQQEQVVENLGIETGGVTDHGALTGLADDDHTQYHTDARGDARYPSAASVTAALAGKAATTHTHAISDTTSLQAALDAKAATTHSHGIADTTGLQAALDGKAATNANTTGYAGALKSATTTVSVAAAAAPTSGQVLTATSGTVATWQTPLNAGALLRGVGELLGYTTAPEAATAPPGLVLEVTVTTGSYTITVNGTVYVFNHAINDSWGGVWVDASSAAANTIAGNLVTAFNALGTGYTAVTSDYVVTIYTSSGGAAQTLSYEAVSGGVIASVSGGGAGTDEVGGSGEVSEVTLIAASGSKVMKPVRFGVSGIGLGTTVQFAHKQGGSYYPIALDVGEYAVAGEPAIEERYDEVVSGRAGASLVARMTGAVPTGNSLFCWAIAERI